MLVCQSRYDILHASRIVIGAEDDYDRTKLTERYKDFAMLKLITNRRSAEMIKYVSNDFLALKISHILLEEGAIVRVYEPAGMERFEEHSYA